MGPDQPTPPATDTQRTDTMDNDKMLERIHALEVAQATQAAATTGAEATQTAMNVGNMATTAAMQAGTVMTMAAGSVALIVGIFLGIALRR
jgi:hypothetical protein